MELADAGRTRGGPTAPGSAAGASAPVRYETLKGSQPVGIVDQSSRNAPVTGLGAPYPRGTVMVTRLPKTPLGDR